MSSLAVRFDMLIALRKVLPESWPMRTVANTRTDVPPDKPFVTVAFQAANALPVTLGTPARVRETGMADVTFWATAGSGTEAALSAAETMSAGLAGALSNKYLSITEIAPPLVADGGEPAGLFAAVSVSVSYVYDFMR